MARPNSEPKNAEAFRKAEGMKSVIVLSGGMDSLTALALMVKQDREILAVNFQYGSKHNAKEALAVKKIADHYKIPLKTITLAFNDYLKSDLLTTGGKIPEGHYAADNMKKTVVPFRNGIMLAIAAGYAESEGAKTLILGNHAGDHAIYPDCRQDFITAMDEAIRVGTYVGVRLESPFVGLTKSEIVTLGEKLNTPYELSWSCYVGEDQACGRCGTCVERLEAFHMAGVADPLTYKDSDYYKTVTMNG